VLLLGSGPAGLREGGCLRVREEEEPEAEEGFGEDGHGWFFGLWGVGEWMSNGGEALVLRLFWRWSAKVIKMRPNLTLIWRVSDAALSSREF